MTKIFSLKVMLLKILNDTQNPEQKALQFAPVILCKSSTILIIWNKTTTSLFSYLGDM